MSVLGRVGVVGAVAGAVLLAGAGSGAAAVTELEPASASVVTDDGWSVSVVASELRVDAVAPLSGSWLSREAFVSAKVTGQISGEGTAPVRSGVIEQGVQIGCEVDVTNGMTLGSTATFGPNVGITMAGPSAGLSSTAGPNVSVQAKPGEITNLVMAEKDLAGDRGSITQRGMQVKVDGCFGEVTMRTYAQVSVTTDTADDTVFVYSTPVTL